MNSVSRELWDIVKCTNMHLMEVSEGDTQDICTYRSSELSFPYLSAWLTHFPLPGLHSNISSTQRSFLTSLCKTATPQPSSPSPNQALPGLLLCIVFLYGGHLPDCLSICLFVCGLLPLLVVSSRKADSLLFHHQGLAQSWHPTAAQQIFFE